MAITSDYPTEVTINNELADRQQAIKLRLAGQAVEDICHLLGRSRDWFHIWWPRPVVNRAGARSNAIAALARRVSLGLGQAKRG